MNNYANLIRKQRLLIGVLQVCTNHKTYADLLKVREEYAKLHILLDQEEELLRSQGLNPNNFLPPPEYDKQEIISDVDAYLKRILNE